MQPPKQAQTSRKRPRQFIRNKNKRSRIEDDEIQALEQRISAHAPAPGTNSLAAEPPEGSYVGVKDFEELPLSKYTKEGLTKAKYINMTAIQRAALPHALCGRDILGAAKTGSGKTLAFLIPVVEKLYRLRWTAMDGLGALILTPTRELAMQIFEELRKVGGRHDISAGLLIGGKDVAEEQQRVNRMNILVATPGRLLQHMDETPGFDASSLQVLVLDEADRILDMGFAATLDAIVDNLPRERQTMLFSATQTKSVKDLARLSLVDPEYISVHAEAEAPTPLKLQQTYAVCELHEKVDVLWSFIRAHLRAKTLVFLSTCKQVRFMFEAFRKLRPGVPLRALHGGMKQMKRQGVFFEYTKAESMVLFATDIAARGLDFPTVDWVVQFDCPEDVATYIHRVGRTARYTSAGRALLLLVPSERDGMTKQLAEAGVPIKQIRLNPAKTQSVGPALQALLSKDQELKEFAQRALIAYLRSIFLQPNKAVFDVAALPVSEFAQSLGLLAPPRLRFLKRTGKKVQEVGGGEAGQNGHDTGSEDEGRDDQPSSQPHKRHKAANGQLDAPSAEPAAAPSKRKAHKEQAGAEASGRNAGGEAGEDDDFLVVKKRNVFDEPEADGVDPAAEAATLPQDMNGKKKKKKQKIKVGAASGKRVVFDEEGRAQEPLALLAAAELGEEDYNAGNADGDGTGLYVVGRVASERFAAASSIMRERDAADKARQKKLRKAMAADKKARKRASMQEQEGGHAVLGRGDEDDDGSEDVSGYESSGDEGGAVPAPIRPEPSHMGMARRSDAPAPEPAPAAPANGHKRKAEDLSVSEQEALVLRMLQSKR